LIDFAGSGRPLSKEGLEYALNATQLDSAQVWAVLCVETSGCGFLPDRRPKILFERHVFSRLTSGQYDADDPDISAPTAGGYGPSGAHQYTRLAAAIPLDRKAALQSASWGLGQIMGENFEDAGFHDIESMVAAMASGEDAQLLAMLVFIKSRKLDQFLRAGDWSNFARLYNGPDYAAHNYDGLLDHFYRSFSSGQLPNLNVRAAQILLMYRGLSPGAIDGIMGRETVAAITSYQSSLGMTATGFIDDILITSLTTEV
jgi:N-acetylmuramidase/Putative peptidoglycan binding domain